MAHIRFQEGLPGIRGPMALSPETARPLGEFTEVLMRGPNTLSPADRELIAAHVSALNDCRYCATSHAAIAACHLGGNEDLVASVQRDFEAAPITEKLKSLLALAGKVRLGGLKVQPQDVERARQQGASDKEIHDTVLIAAAFSMFNRYVDGLATWAPEDQDSYRQRAAAVARDGYTSIGRQIEETLRSQGH